MKLLGAGSFVKFEIQLDAVLAGFAVELVRNIAPYMLNHRNSKSKTDHNVLFRQWLWQPDSNIRQKKQEVEGLYYE